jgi:hypothetical protein
MFNCGFWGSKKGLVSEQDLYDTFAECAAHPNYFDFSEKPPTSRSSTTNSQAHGAAV